jgi:ribosomal protein S18 acetylase RimI-like enzyme
LPLEGTLLDLVWVKPSVRSKGIGAALMENVEHQAALDRKELTLEVWTVNRRAVDFYERRGFSVDGTVEDPRTASKDLSCGKRSRQSLSSLPPKELDPHPEQDFARFAGIYRFGRGR